MINFGRSRRKLWRERIAEPATACRPTTAPNITECWQALWTDALNAAASREWLDKTTLADPESIRGRLMDAGISLLQTDEPEALKAYIEGRRA